MQEIVGFIKDLGFPIFVAVWLLFKGSKDTNALRDAIIDLKNTLSTLTGNNFNNTNNDIKKVS